MSLIDRSKQRWKIQLFIGLMAAGAVVTLFQGFFAEYLNKEILTTLVIAAMLLIVGTFVWAGKSIACPRCGRRLLFYAITKVGLGTWYNWLVTEEKCPDCGYSGTESSTTHRRNKGTGRYK